MFAENDSSAKTTLSGGEAARASTPLDEAIHVVNQVNKHAISLTEQLNDHADRLTGPSHENDRLDTVSSPPEPKMYHLAWAIEQLQQQMMRLESAVNRNTYLA